MKKLLSIIVPFSLGYLITCIFRSINAVQGVYLEKDLSLTLYQIGVITSVFFITFCFGQIPLGIYLDRYGARRVQSTLFLIASAGTLLFAFASNYYLFIVARLIIGLGICGGLMSAFKANVENYPNKVPLLNGIIMVSGGIGMIIAGKPSEMLIERFGWRSFNIGIALALIIISFIILFLYHEDEKIIEINKTIKNEMIEIFSFCINKELVLLSLVSVIPLAFFVSLQGLWITPFLQNVNGMNFNKIAIFISLIGAFMTAGLLIAGVIGQYYQKKYGSMHKVLFFGVLISIILQLIITVNLSFLSIFSWLLYSFVVQVGTLGYAQVAIFAGSKKAGKAVAMFNVLLFIFSFLFQYMFGLLVSFIKNTTSINHGLMYQIILTIFILIQIASAGIFRVKEKRRFENDRIVT